MRKISEVIVRAIHEDEGHIERFWSRVDRDPAPDGCWEWRGLLKSNRYPTFAVGYHSIAATRVAWFTATGELPAGGHLLQLCENGLCVRPAHLAWLVGQRTSRVLEARGDGYLTVSGVPVPHAEDARRRPRILRCA